MGIIELLVIVLIVLWALGYFGRGRFYGRGVDGGGSDSNLVHTLLVIALILIVLRVLRLL